MEDKFIARQAGAILNKTELISKWARANRKNVKSYT